jgi:hypothetical protein
LLSAALSFFVPHNAKRYYTLAFPGYRFDMKFNHLIVINDPLNPLIEPLTRNQLWQGLVLRAEQPMRFVPHLDQCDLLQRTGDVLQRELRYGTLVIRDEVTFVPQQEVRYDVPAQQEIPASSLTMSISEPQEGLLVVRFDYEDGTSDLAGSMDAFYNEFRRSAYQEADIDTIRIIRQLADEGRFGPP